MKFYFHCAVLLMAGIFTFQTFDIPPARNPKTCCGRPVCLCKHAPGAACPIRLAKSNPNAVKKSCHLPKKVKAETVPLKQAEDGFTKAPCHKDSPKAVILKHSKEFIFTDHLFQNDFNYHENAVPFFIGPLPSLVPPGIEHPPRVF